MRILTALSVSTLFVGLLQTTATAGLSPKYDSFGSLPDATFGGTGIPNNAVAIREIKYGNINVTLGLSATQRFGSPSLTNNNAGIFQAQPGPSQGGSDAAAWNFNYYIDLDGASSNQGWTFQLDYTLDPDASLADYGTITLGRPTVRIWGVSVPLYTSTTWQDSQNLDFDFLRTGYDPLGGLSAGRVSVSPPESPFNSFDYDRIGTYGFQLTAFHNGIQVGESVSILVNVGDVNPVPEPSTLLAGLLGVGLVTGVYCRRNRQTRSLS